jgi:predicted nucleotidyltransferase
MMARVRIDRAAIGRLCQKHAIRELSLFGSVIRDDFRPDSDVDVLVEFEPEARVGLLTLARIIEELSELFEQEVDVVTKNSLSPYLRDRILTSREVVYARAQ